ncbi:MAG: hypothetical protein Q9201_002620 [Fulgogasparrea decipioides]
MSLDLLQAFGDSSQGAPVNPWAGSNNDNTGSLEEDDFGEFEQPNLTNLPDHLHEQTSEHTAPPLAADDCSDGQLIDIGLAKLPPSPSFQELNAHLKLFIPPDTGHDNSTNTKREQPSPITAWPSYSRNRAKSFRKPFPLSPYADDDDVDWGDFEEESVDKHVTIEEVKSQSTVVRFPAEEKAEHGNSLLDLTDSQGIPTTPTTAAPNPANLSPTGPPPSNIPPPSILLSIVSSICQSLPAEIRDISSSMGTATLNNGSALDSVYLQSLACTQAIVNASARILAGRKPRWKRDTHLAQNMRIGTANGGKASGMKLTGIDRTETRREEQEAAEVVRLWKQQLGGLKSHVARINAQQSEIQLSLPELSENLPIRIAKAGEGGISAPRCCFLCGLKRDERVAKLDANVEDSFGEWWVDHWGHVDCIRFWEEHKDSLKHR